MIKEDQQWDYLKKVKEDVINWANNHQINLHTIHFIPMSDYSLEVYVFYECDIDIIQSENNGVSDKVKQYIIKALNDLNYMDIFNDNLTFIFDSHENVCNNYQGSYFLRLR